MLNNISVKYASNNSLDAVFMSLSDPTRRTILEMLRKGDASVNEIARPFSMTLPAISRHLKVLERSGLISRRRKAQTLYCHLEQTALQEGIDWMKECQTLWENALPNLEKYVQLIQSDQKHSRES